MQESTEITPRREAHRGLWVTSILCQFFNLFAALKDEDREGLVNALKNLAGQHSDVLENVTPKIRRRVEVLREIQIDTVSSCEHEPVWREIDWYPGKCLTQKILKKKPKKGAKNAKPITKTEDCESFFNFFNPPQVPDDDEDIDEDRAEELQNLMEQDYDIGSTIREKIVPHAVSWFTGEAIEGEEFEIDNDKDDDDDDIDDDDDEDDDQKRSRQSYTRKEADLSFTMGNKGRGLLNVSNSKQNQAKERWVLSEFHVKCL
ncbi:unnamed protein product [Brassica oleracea var. botrytis]